jgi:hypothetical protein
MFRLLGFLLLFIVRPVQAMSFKVETLGPLLFGMMFMETGK